MSPRVRLFLFAVACACLLPAVVAIALHMPRFGDHPMPYGAAINAAAPGERHVSNMVSAVNFDYRGFDTLGEEFMLLCAVTGTVVLLRGSRGERLGARPGRLPGRPLLPRSPAATLICRVAAPLVMLFGIYVALHAMTTPGGGFQGGVIVATGALLVYLGDGYEFWRRLMLSPALAVCEGLGATLYALCGFAGMATGHGFMQNFLPLGTLKDVFSGGLMQIENAGVALAVFGGFGTMFVEFLEETRAVEPGDDETGDDETGDEKTGAEA
jgi:multicomponent Na+:H+ antiporter subunit B